MMLRDSVTPLDHTIVFALNIPEPVSSDPGHFEYCGIKINVMHDAELGDYWRFKAGDDVGDQAFKIGLWQKLHLSIDWTKGHYYLYTEREGGEAYDMQVDGTFRAEEEHGWGKDFSWQVN